jgi:hypothetical protein
MSTLHIFKLQAGVEDNPDQEGLDLFAQLIIQECARIAEQPHEYIRTQSGEHILKHFGVDV